MRPIIGILFRDGKSSSKLNIDIVYDDIRYAIRNSGGIPIGVPCNDIHEYFDICSGFVLQGGDDISNASIVAIKKIIENNIPLLGICLGMQEMGYVYDAKIIDVPNHKGNKILHDIIIDKDSLLYKIIGKDTIIVNSRHQSAIINPKIKISSRGEDNIIESIENSKLKFFLGVQWHPESMYKVDIYARKIFDYFIKICND